MSYCCIHMATVGVKGPETEHTYYRRLSRWIFSTWLLRPAGRPAICCCERPVRGPRPAMPDMYCFAAFRSKFPFARTRSTSSWSSGDKLLNRCNKNCNYTVERVSSHSLLLTQHIIQSIHSPTNIHHSSSYFLALRGMPVFSTLMTCLESAICSCNGVEEC